MAGTPMLVALMASFLLCDAATARAEDLPDELWAPQAQPATFQIVEVVHVEGQRPKTISLADSLLEQNVGAGAGADIYWQAIANNPSEYLAPSQEMEAISEDDLIAWGTAVCVSREGILLTNAHMIQDDDRSGLIAGIDAPFVQVVNELKDRFGDYPDRQQLLLLREWYLNQSTGTGKFKEVQVVLKYSEPMQLTADETMQHVLAHELFPNVSGLVFGPGPEDLVRQPLTVRAVPLAAGTPIPGKDIAVLKVSPDADDPVDPRDRLICLPLGDSDAVIPGSFPIQALGYPGAAFDPYLMNEGAGYRVNSQDGQIDQLREMQGGWNAFEMTALIYHGHSGGPVIDRHGNIVALNVGVAQENPNVEVFGRTLAVPINLVREFLRQAGIDALDPGPLVERWNDGLRAFAKGDYATAFSDFSIILYRQAAPFEPTSASNVRTDMLTPPKTARLLPTAAQASKPPPPVEKYLSPYVEDMWLRSLRLLP